ncbi:hypothetical protein, partial [Haematospirillum jordaniae]|uniref:hypothetical protein n=1 Tax=Haematospirillum jordaniae TaxID=1549855 RepID=UPI0038D11B9D
MGVGNVTHVKRRVLTQQNHIHRRQVQDLGRPQGGRGNDLLEGRGGRDTIDGGDGIDTVSYAFLDRPVSITL